jgi:hypothetical protein
MSNPNSPNLQDWEITLFRLYSLTSLLSRSIHWSASELPCGNHPAVDLIYSCGELAEVIRADLEELKQKVEQAR